MFLSANDFEIASNDNLNNELNIIYKKNMEESGFFGNQYYYENRIIHAKTPNAISEGWAFDLGERTLKVLNIPGHTTGSMMFLDEQNKLLFSGDSIVDAPISIYDGLGSTNIQNYMYNLQRLTKYKNDIELIFPGHYVRPIGYRYIDDLLNLSKKIIEGTAHTEIADLSNFTDQDARVSSYRTASIIYTIDKVRY